MKKLLFIGSMFFVTLNYSCTQTVEKAEETAEAGKEGENTKEEPVSLSVGITFRSDGVHPGIASEWIQLNYGNDSKLNEIYYWNSNDETKKKLEILNQDHQDGEISATTGQLKFKGNPTVYNFSCVENMFNLFDTEAETFQEFEQE